MQLSPMPPQPITATVLPGMTCAACHTEPIPVSTAQPIGATTSSGTSERIFTTLCWCTTIFSANDASPADWMTGLPSMVSADGSPGARSSPTRLQSTGRPDRQKLQCPQNADGHVTTESPTATSVTALPIASTTPAASWPSTRAGTAPRFP